MRPERAPSTSMVPEAPRAPLGAHPCAFVQRVHPRRAAGIAAVLGALTMLSAGCFGVVSLGEGSPETHDPTDPILITHLPIPSGDTDPFPEDGQCAPGPHTDNDGDGFTPEQGDCDDCDPAIGPDAVELPTDDGQTPADDDCDGLIDEPAQLCDDGLKTGELSPYAAARALDMCQIAEAGRWGVTAAAWVLPDGGPAPLGPQYDLGHGILPDFGPNMKVRGGSRLLALSTGVARLPGDPDFGPLGGFDKEYTSKPLEGLPGDTTVCPGVDSGAPHDAAALEVTLRTPQNAESIAFDFDFYSHEFPEGLCTRHDDLFVALLDPPVPGGPGANIAFDAVGNPISVNSARFEACQCTNGPPCLFHGVQYGCSLGAKPLAGTGFGGDLPTDTNHGATGWLVAEAPVAARSTIRLRFAIQDAEDGSLDSTVLLDHFRFQGAKAQIPKSGRPTGGAP